MATDAIKQRPKHHLYLTFAKAIMNTKEYFQRNKRSSGNQYISMILLNGKP